LPRDSPVPAIPETADDENDDDDEDGSEMTPREIFGATVRR
jgi:hypothetical protein